MASLVTIVQLTAVVTTAILIALCMVSTVNRRDPNFDHPGKSLVKTIEQPRKDGNNSFRGIAMHDGCQYKEFNRDGIDYVRSLDPKVGTVLAADREDQGQHIC